MDSRDDKDREARSELPAGGGLDDLQDQLPNESTVRALERVRETLRRMEDRQHRRGSGEGGRGTEGTG